MTCHCVFSPECICHLWQQQQQYQCCSIQIDIDNNNNNKQRPRHISRQDVYMRTKVFNRRVCQGTLTFVIRITMNSNIRARADQKYNPDSILVPRGRGGGGIFFYFIFISSFSLLYRVIIPSNTTQSNTTTTNDDDDAAPTTTTTTRRRRFSSWRRGPAGPQSHRETDTRNGPAQSSIYELRESI